MKTAKLLLFVVLFTVLSAAGALAASQTKLLSSDLEEADYFGSAVAISGDYAIIGAFGENTNNAGAVYIFHRTGDNTWDAGTKITSPTPQMSGEFGRSVSLEGDYAIVGAHQEDLVGTDEGAAYIFHRTGDNSWDAGTKIVAGDAENSDDFGNAVAIFGDYAIVGARYEDTGGSNAGAAYIFNRTGINTWDAGTKIVASGGAASDLFGHSVAIAGDYAIVGAYGQDSAGNAAGAAYIFNRTGLNTWDAGTQILSPNPEALANFGFSVALSGDYAIVGAYVEDGGTSDAGAAYIFHRTGLNTWDAGTRIVASDREASDSFGVSVSISGPYAVVGAYAEDTGATGAGAAYLFNRTAETTWSAGTKIQATVAETFAYYGYSVSISGYYALIGTNNEDSGGLSNSGAAYSYKHDLPAAVDLLAFTAEWAEVGAVLSWITGSETDCGAFTLLRCEVDDLWNTGEPACAADDYRELDLVIPCADSLYGADYEAVDPTADPAASYFYLLREYETTGGVKEYGPVFLDTVKYGDAVPDGDDENPGGDDERGEPSDDDEAESGDDDDPDEAVAEADDPEEDTDAGCGF